MALPAGAPGGSQRRFRNADICVVFLAAALTVQSLFLLHVLSEVGPSLSTRESSTASSGFSGRLGLAKLTSWYCNKASARERSVAAALLPAKSITPQCVGEVTAALQAQAPCPVVRIHESCRPVPSNGAKCPECPVPSKCPAGEPASGGLRQLAGAAVTPSPHKHELRSEVEELAEFGESLRRRFTDMACYLYGDESEVCAYENAICFDGTHVALSVPHPPPAHPKLDPLGAGLVLGDPSGGCFDWRYYEPSALEYSACKAEQFPFQRVSRYAPAPEVSASPSAHSTPGVSGTGTSSRTRSQAARPSRRPDGSGGTGISEDDLPVRHHNADWALPLERRRWGPHNRGAVKFREISDAALHGPRPKSATVLADGAVLLGDKHSALLEWGKLRAAGPPAAYPFGYKPDSDPVLAKLHGLGLRIASVGRPSKNGSTVYWLDGSLWATAMDAQFDRHIYHATTRLMGLYHAQRANRTAAWGDSTGDGYLPPLTDVPRGRGYDSLPPVPANHPLEERFKLLQRLALSPADAAVFDEEVAARWKAAHGNSIAGSGRATIVRPNRVSYASSHGWDLPPQDYVFLVGNNQSPPGQMIPFLKHVAALIAQPHTVFAAGPALAAALGPNRTSLVCARRGAVTGTHPRLFVNKADAWMFRQYAYQFAGAAARGLHPHMHHPPRKVTVLTRKPGTGRNFENHAAVVAAVAASGLPYEIVTDMGDLSFKEQVLKMAGTGILVAAHGAALVNAMFLPQHAVVLEIFPYMLKKATYINLAGLLGLWHLPLYCGLPTMTGAAAEANVGVQMARTKASNGQDFFEGCVGANMSSVDSLLHHRCNSVAKHLPVKVDIPAFKHALREAADIIAGFSALNPAWAEELAKLKGSPAATKSQPTPAAVAKAAAPGAGGGGKSGTPTRTRTGSPTRSVTPTPTSEALAPAADASEEAGIENEQDIGTMDDQALSEGESESLDRELFGGSGEDGVG